MDLRDLLTLTLKRRWLVLGVMAACLLLSGGFVATQTKQYESTASIALTPNTNGESVIAPDALAALLGTYAETAKSRLLLRRASTALGRPIVGRIETDAVAGTGILRITDRSPDAAGAAAEANAVAAAFKASIAGNALIVATIVDPAQPGTSPVQPKPKLTFAVAALLGLFAGVVLAFVLEQLRRRITTPADVRELTPAPLVGRLGRRRELARHPGTVVWDQPDEAELQESYRALRTNLQFVFPSQTGLLQITSAEPGAGKSTVSVNLAIALGQIGIRTILVDADLRRPRIHTFFGLDNSFGLSSLMSKQGVSSSKILPSGYDNLHVLPSGPPVADPTEMLSLRIGPLLARLRRLNALVIIDAPPLLPVSDARLVASHVDGVLLLVAAGSERPARLELALERLQLANAPLLGVILNKAPDDEVTRAGAYGYGGYAEDPVAGRT